MNDASTALHSGSSGDPVPDPASGGQASGDCLGQRRDEAASLTCGPPASLHAGKPEPRRLAGLD